MDLVKILIDDDGEEIEDPKWHLVQTVAGCRCTVCTGEFFGDSVSGVVYEHKVVQKGGVNCPDCIEIVKWFKAIKL